MCSWQYFLHSVGWQLLLLVTFAEQKLFDFMQSPHLSILRSVSCTSKVFFRNVLPVPLSVFFLTVVSLKPLIHFVCVCVQGERYSIIC